MVNNGYHIRYNKIIFFGGFKQWDNHGIIMDNDG